MSAESKINFWGGTARRVRCFLEEERAVESAEYAFMLALMIVGLVGVIGLLGEANEKIWAFVDVTISDSADQYL